MPGVSVLARIVARERDAATVRVWTEIAQCATAGQARSLPRLLDVRDGARQSELDRIRQAETAVSGVGMVRALTRVSEISAVGLGELDLSGVPQRRVVALARYGMAATATALRRHPEPRRLATLVATVRSLEARSVDDALELFDVLMTNDLLARASRESRQQKLRRYPRLSKDAGRLAAAVGVLLDALEREEPLALEAVWEQIESKVSREDLRSAVAHLTEVALPPDADADGEWRSALVERYASIRAFVPMLRGTITFAATADAAGVLSALRDLPRLLDARATKAVPVGYLDARQVAVDVVPAGWWRRLVFKPDRPEGTVDRAAYVFCVLEQFHRHLLRRDIHAAPSARYADPRAKLLTGHAWEAAKGPALNALSLPEDPEELLLEHSAALDGAWRGMADSLTAGTVAHVDSDWRLHAEKIDAIPDPPSLVDLRRRLEAMLPRVDLPELILEVMGWLPAFAEAFTGISGGQSRMRDLDVTIAAALTAHALNVGYVPVISEGVPALTRGRISHVAQNYLRPENYTLANAALITAQDGIDLARRWGGGLVAGIDGMRFVVPVRSIHARPNSKYFGRRRGATWLNMISDQGVRLAGRVLSGTPRDSLHVIDLIYRQDAGRRPEGDRHRHRLLQRHRLRRDHPARLRLPPPTRRPPPLKALADQPGRRLRAAEPGRPREARPDPHPPSLARHPAADRRNPHRRDLRPRRAPDPRAGRHRDPARRRARPIRTDLQDAAHSQLHRRRAVPPRDQSDPQPPRRPPRPCPDRVPRPQRRAPARLPRRDGRPARRARPRPQHDHAVEHRLPRPRRQPAARGRLPRPRCRPRTPLAIHAPAHQLPRPLLLQPTRPTRRSPRAP